MRAVAKSKNYSPNQDSEFKIDFPGRSSSSSGIATGRQGLKGTMKNLLKSNPFTRSIFNWLVTLIKIGKLKAEIFDRLDGLDLVSQKIEKKVAQQLGESFNSITKLEAKMAQISTSRSADISTANLYLSDTMSLDEYYFHFENQFRGPREQIVQELAAYIPYLIAKNINFSETPVLDVGCGRGEWLEILKSKQVRSSGIDINKTMVDFCSSLGLDAKQGDAIAYLKSLPARSLGGVTAFQVVEHIPFEGLVLFLKECRRVLIPNGFVLFETPNPENYRVGSCDFYYDMTHINPIPPAALGFLLGNTGFTKMETIRSQPVTENASDLASITNPTLKHLAERFFGPRNYAIFASI